MSSKHYFNNLPSQIRRCFRVIRPDHPKFIIVEAKRDCFLVEPGVDGPIYIDFDFMD